MFRPGSIVLRSFAFSKIPQLAILIAVLSAMLALAPRLAAQAGEWTWMGGSQTPGAAGVCGTPGVPSANNIPGSREWAVTWTDLSGNLWLFGGDQYDPSAYDYTFFNDLWEYAPSTGEWTCVARAPPQRRGKAPPPGRTRPAISGSMAARRREAH